MKQTATILRRIQTERKLLNEGVTDLDKILRQLKDEGFDLSRKTLENDIHDIYSGEYPDPWLDNFLNVIYPEIFKNALNEITEAKNNLKEIARAKAYNHKVRISANTNYAKINLDLINLIHKGPSVKMMRQLKQKAQRLAREVTEERKITKKIQDEEEPKS